MRRTNSRALLAMAAGAGLWLGTVSSVAHQAPGAGSGQPAAQRGGGRGGGRGAVATGVFTAADVNKDGAITRDELKSTFDKWYAEWDSARTGSVTQEQLNAGLTAALPQPAPPAAAAPAQPPPPDCGGRSSQPQSVCPGDLQAMMAALPDRAPAKPARPRKVLVLAATAGFVHSSIPLAAKTIEALGEKTGAWTTTVSYDRSVITAENLEQYDAIFLDSTTGTFLDEPNAATDAAAKTVTDARRQALLEFIRSGKGLAGIHAASDSYHGNPNPAPEGRASGGPPAPGAGRGGSGAMLSVQMVAQGDRNNDQKLSREEVGALVEAWYDKLDPQRAGRVVQADFSERFSAIVTPAPPVQGAARGGGRGAGGGGGVPLWPEFNKIIGGYFKHHWNYPTTITVKIDDPKSPVNAPFKGQPFDITDEVYTYNQDSFSRDNVHVLTSIDYSKMSPEIRAQESNPRTDQDYALSWIRREGKGRVFYEALGHHETIYAKRPMLEHILAGMQYVLGDLKADDSPGRKVGTK
jgi:type 1 glutamine amidotransferase